MPQIHIEGAEDFAREVLFAESAKAGIRGEVWEVIKAVATQAREEIKRDMPVDTGDARGRWGTPEYHMTRPRYGGAPGQGIWREDKDNLTHTQGAELSPFEYIERLNEGYSQQAPAGFIDTTVERVNDDLTDGLLNATVQVLERP